MNKFFVNKEIYKERLDTCRNCSHYFKPTGNCKVCGCFMRIKASIASMSCPKNYWTNTTEVEAPDEVPEHLLEELKEVWEHIKNKTATNHEYKARAIELYNAIFNANHKTTTNCSSCLNNVWTGLSSIINKNK